MMADYEVYILTPQNVLRAVVTNFSRLEYTLVVNAIHALTLELPGVVEFEEDDRIEVYRDGALVGDTQFLAAEISTRLSAGGEYTTVVSAVGALAVLNWPVVNYAPGMLQSHQSGYAGDVIKQLARQNLGSLATDTARNMSEYLAVQDYANDGALVSVDSGWRRLLDVIKEVAGCSAENGIDLFYDVVKNASGKLELRTYTGQRGTDRSTTVLLTPERANMGDCVLTRDYSTGANRVIVGGTGQELWRVVTEVPNSAQVNSSPWGYIKEHFYTCQAETVNNAVLAGQSYLRLSANKVTLSGTPIQTPGTQYGVHYGWGDQVSIEFLGYVAVVSVDRVQVSVQDGKEDVRMEARGNIV
jgi:hypothetical protein